MEEERLGGGAGRNKEYFFCGEGIDDGQTSWHPAIKNLPKQTFGNMLGN